ncbi:MAG TPA: tol-pal system protein YbgF [Kofleriaceae bacterium]|nr:tol-pal system protein YbgF [Kofleriaceae bacterium]
MSHRAHAALALVLATACGGPAQQIKGENHSLQLKINQLHAEGRRDRARIHDLENQILLMQDKLETAQLARGGAGAPVPRLPVEVLEPEPAANPDFRVVGVDPDGNEIVYTGDAMHEGSVSPSMDRYADDDDGGGGVSNQPVGPERRDLEEVPESKDRIAVTGSVPSIDEQLRSARAGRPSAPARPVAIETTDAESLYHQYQAALAAGRHAEAIAGFRDFLVRYPRHDYADNAQYWLGEAYYAQRQYREAMTEFRKVVKNYPRGNKVPDALLKVGYCYAALGELDKARDVLGQVTTIYPTSAPAHLAAQKLAELEEHR